MIIIYIYINIIIYLFISVIFFMWRHGSRQVGQARAFQADRRRVALRYWQSKGPKPEKDSDSDRAVAVCGFGHRP